MNRLTVERSLGLAQLQDGGRFGVRHLGVTQGGALDWIAMGWANWMLGNVPTACALEIPMGGVTLRCESDTTLALAGADLSVTLDEQAIAPWRSFPVQRGQRLEFNSPFSGVRAYLAAPGGFRAPRVLGSASTVTRESLGGLDGSGQALRRDDRLEFESLASSPRTMPEQHIPAYGHAVRLELIPGAQIAGFTGESLFRAFNHPWRIDPRSDRMGVRLSGKPLRYTGAPLISEGIPLGAVQVPPDGQPIVLMNDRQTIGGYPRLGALTPASVARLAQCATDDNVWLTAVGQGKVREEMIELLDMWDSGMPS
ncbi:biotin-dependent carboxyltransferase family protein [Pseudomonas sp. OIL-1]|uniref:5-oxoprolinase subunit C family protein n=1 Tax=Pseudomonas sp. OIL-1 TaxID=2706126 RepID=UPI0013A795C6|nr:biotin-dependent carboxyltransferase family protein [Pseudomonas sp. OIL-1]QIB50394.1 biotin-dependent carboxyltransferase [Pseudomonas sp. OIL-1]